MESFWNGFEKRAGIVNAARSAFGKAKGLASRVIQTSPVETALGATALGATAAAGMMGGKSTPPKPQTPQY